MERSEQNSDISNTFNRLTRHEPKAVSGFVPSNGDEQKEAFLAGYQRTPEHVYSGLAKIDFDERQRQLDSIGDKLLNHAQLNKKHLSAYNEFISAYKKRTRFMQAAHNYKTSSDQTEKDEARSEFMALNIELYGEPDEIVYRSLLQEKLTLINNKTLSEKASNIFVELKTMLSIDESSTEPLERFKPADETIQWMHDTVEGLYGTMLAHVPEEKELFSPLEVQEVFTRIVENEFGEAAAGWRVDIESAQAIKVLAAEKRIVIPIDRAPIGRQELRRLVVHEIGVHMLRSVMGASTDLRPLKTGLSEYYEAEEGLGVVMEQALRGSFIESGINHYITTGLAYFDQKDFRETFECKWRLNVLEKLVDGEDVSDKDIEKSRRASYSACMRIFRGTDELPWFKDLAYYNGSVNMWRHLEEIRGDDLMFTFVLLGKADPSNISHRRSMRETKSI